MALIECPECGREVSSSAAACPECGYPVKARIGPAGEAPPKRRWWKLAIPILGRVFVGAMLAGVGGGEEESAAAVIGGLIIAGSAIPVWYRDKIDRLKTSRSSAALDSGVEERMAELERRHREQIAHLEQTHTEQMADLEERIDFAERLLTKRTERIGPG